MGANRKRQMRAQRPVRGADGLAADACRRRAFGDRLSLAVATEQSQELVFREFRACVIAIFPGPDAGPFLFFEEPQSSSMPLVCGAINVALLPYDFAQYVRTQIFS